MLRSYERGALIHGGGAECLGMALVLSGLARAYVLSGEGREVTLFRIAGGGGCVLSASCVISEINFDTFLGAERDTRLLIVPSGVFGRLAESNLRVKLWMYEQAASRFSDVMWSMQNLLFNRFDRRLADFPAGGIRARRLARDTHDARADRAEHLLGARGGGPDAQALRLGRPCGRLEARSRQAH